MKSLLTFLLFALISVTAGVGVKAADVTTEKSYSIVTHELDGLAVDVQDNICLNYFSPDSPGKRFNRFEDLFNDADNAFTVSHQEEIRELRLLLYDGLISIPDQADRQYYISVSDQKATQSWRFKPDIQIMNFRQTVYLHMNAPPPYCYLGKHKFYRYRRSYLA